MRTTSFWQSVQLLWKLTQITTTVFKLLDPSVAQPCDIFKKKHITPSYSLWVNVQYNICIFDIFNAGSSIYFVPFNLCTTCVSRTKWINKTNLKICMKYLTLDDTIMNANELGLNLNISLSWRPLWFSLFPHIIVKRSTLIVTWD